MDRALVVYESMFGNAQAVAQAVAAGLSSRLRASCKTDRPLVSRGIGLREYLRQLRSAAGFPAAVFDTRLVRPRWLRLFRSAAPKIEAQLRALGFTILVPAESFFVAGETGPLLPHELDRARSWGTALARAHKASPQP
jgi:hypothetical protein